MKDSHLHDLCYFSVIPDLQHVNFISFGWFLKFYEAKFCMHFLLFRYILHTLSYNFPLSDNCNCIGIMKNIECALKIHP
jgi:hypothetical protein